MNRNARFRRTFAIVLLAACAFALAQTADKNPDIAAFALLEQWKNAVLAGDTASLKALYSTSPPTQVAAPGDQNTADAEVNFWIGLKARQLNLNVVQSSSPQPDVQVIALQAEIQPAGSTKAQTLYVTEAQAWQKQADQWRLVNVRRTGAEHLQQPVNKDKNIYPANVDARVEIKEAEEKAAVAHKRVLVVFGANWCYDCHVLDMAFHRPDFAPLLAASYEVAHVDIGEDGKKNGDLAKEFHVPLEKGIPALAVLESNGKLVVSQKNGEFENARAMTPDALLEFLNKWKPQTR